MSSDGGGGGAILEGPQQNNHNKVHFQGSELITKFRKHLLKPACVGN